MNKKEKMAIMKNFGGNAITQQYMRNYKKKIRNVYRLKTTLAPSYLNNKLDMENELRAWGYKWYRTKAILAKRTW